MTYEQEKILTKVGSEPTSFVIPAVSLEEEEKKKKETC